MHLNAHYPAAPSGSNPTASEALVSSSAREDPQDDSTYCLITRNTLSVEANADNGAGTKQPPSNQAIPVPTPIDEPYRRLWALVSVALLDLAFTSWFYLRSTKASLIATPFSNPAQTGLTRLVGLGNSRSITYITIGLSKKWRKMQLFIVAGLVVTLLGVLWEVNLAVQWRGWDRKQLEGQVQGEATMMIDFAVFGKVVKIRLTNLVQYLCFAIYFIHLHLSPLSAEDIHILQTQLSRPRNRYTAREARIRQRSTTISYIEDDEHLTRPRDGCGADQPFPNYGCFNSPSTPTHLTAAHMDTSSPSVFRQASTSASNKSRYLHPHKYALAGLPDTDNLLLSPCPSRKSGGRRADRRHEDLNPGRDLLATSWGSPTRHGAYTSTPDSKRRRTSGSRRISRLHGLQPESDLMAGSDGEAEGTTSGSEEEEVTSTEEEEVRREDGNESDRTEEAHDGEEEESDASSISSDEIVDMPPPRSTRTIRSPISSPLINGSMIRRPSSFSFPTTREARNPSSPLSSSSSGFNAREEEQGSLSSTISGAGTEIPASSARIDAMDPDDGDGVDLMDTSLRLAQGETRLDKALRVRWIRGHRARHQRSKREEYYSRHPSSGGRLRSQAQTGRSDELSDTGETPGAGYGTF